MATCPVVPSMAGLARVKRIDSDNGLDLVCRQRLRIPQALKIRNHLRRNLAVYLCASRWFAFAVILLFGFCRAVDRFHLSPGGFGRRNRQYPGAGQ